MKSKLLLKELRAALLDGTIEAKCYSGPGYPDRLTIINTDDETLELKWLGARLKLKAQD